jgi:hypothetical protein
MPGAAVPLILWDCTMTTGLHHDNKEAAPAPPAR